MKKMLLIFTLAMAGGCTQDSLNETHIVVPNNMHTDMKPPIGRVVIIPHDEMLTKEGMASLRNSVCDQNYVLQIKPITQHAGIVPLRVFSKDGSNAGWSTAITTIPYHTIDTVWSTILIYDADDLEVCFSSTNNVAFIQPFFFAEDIEFQVRFFNVSGSANTSPETILWEQGERYYFTMYPAASGDCSNQNPQYCCDYDFSADIYGSSSFDGTMRFFFAWDNTGYDLEVPPEDFGDHEATNCGANLVSWYADNHVTTNGEGSCIFNCDNTSYLFIIGDEDEVHGVLIDPDGRMCKLTY